MDTDQENKHISDQLDTLTIAPSPGPESSPAPESSPVSASALQKIARTDMETLYSSLGSGIFSDVYVAKYKDQKIALKKYKNSITDPVLEAGVHANLEHTNIIKLIGYIQESSMSALLLEYCNENDLDLYLEYGEVSDSEREREKIALDIAKGLVYLHEVHRIIHRDIKPGNILLHKKHKVITAKITDFGFAKKLKDNETSYIGAASGTPAFACPEILAYSSNGLHTSSFPGDIFAFGHIIHLLTQSGNSNPLQGFTTVQQVFTFIKEGRVSKMPLFEAYSTATTRTLIRRCHMTDPKTRITANEIVKQFESGHTLFHSPKMD